MTGTSVGEFDRFLSLVPGAFDLHFIPVRKGGKSPKTAKGRSWKEDPYRLGGEGARVRLERGENVGFVARNDLVVLDIDDESRARELLDDLLWNTLAVSTRSGGTHLYFVNGGVGNADVPGVVEVRAEWRYALVPGSYVDPEGTGGSGLYEVENAEPPAMLFPSDLPGRLLATRESDEDEPPILGEPGGPIRNRHGWTIEDIRGEDGKLDELLSRPNPFGYPSVSEADFAACTKLLYWEFSPGQVKDILRGFRGRPKVLERPDYVRRTVERARSRVDATISDSVDPDTWRPGDIFDEIETGDDGP